MTGVARELLDKLGPAPLAPLEPVLTCPEPTYEGLCKLLAVGQPSVGIFSAEGGQFIGGYGMTDDAKLRTAAGLSSLWDGEPIKRARALDGITVIPGRRVAMHLMAQPDVAAIWFRRTAPCRSGADVARFGIGAGPGKRHANLERAVTG